MGVASGCGYWEWVEYMGVATGCGCMVYISSNYLSLLLLYLFFLHSIPTICSLKKMFFVLW